MSNASLIVRGREMCSRIVGTVDWHTVHALVDALAAQDAYVNRILSDPEFDQEFTRVRDQLAAAQEWEYRVVNPEEGFEGDATSLGMAERAARLDGDHIERRTKAVPAGPWLALTP